MSRTANAGTTAASLRQLSRSDSHLPYSDDVSRFTLPCHYGTSVVDDFLTDDVDDQLFDPVALESSPGTLMTVRSCPSLFFTRFTSFDSILPHLIARGGKSLALTTFCSLVERSQSLQNASILSVECYTERTRLGVLHRFLIFHLRRDHRTDIWLRTDRLRAANVSIPLFVLRGGKTQANDVAQLASSKADLIRTRAAKLETISTFEEPPNLGVFSAFLRIICDELVDYRVWPENCWLFCSLLQEYISAKGRGVVTFGKHFRLGQFRRIRTRVKNRMLLNPPSVLEWSLSVSGSAYCEVSAGRVRVLATEYERHRHDAKALAYFIEGLSKEITTLNHESSIDPSNTAAQHLASNLALQVLRLEHLRSKQIPAIFSSQLSKALHVYQTFAVPIGPALVVVRVADILRDLYQDNPGAYWHRLASQLMRVARIISRSDPALARACSREAQRVLAQSSNGNSQWSDSQILRGHEGGVCCVAFSPDGEMVVSSSVDYTVRRWNARTGEPFGGPMKAHTALVRSVAFSPDGSRIVSGSNDGTVRRWDAVSGNEVGVMHARPRRSGSLSCVTSVAYSPDGSLIVSGSKDSCVQRWDACTGESLGEPLEGHTDAVCSVEFSPDGKQMASVAMSGVVRVWDTCSGEAIGAPMSGHTDAIHSVAYSPDGRIIVSGGWDCTIRRWDAETHGGIGKPMDGHTQVFHSVAFSPDGRLLASGSGGADSRVWDEITGDRVRSRFPDHSIRIWDAMTGDSVEEPLRGHEDDVRSVAFSPNGRCIVSGSKDGTVRFWDRLPVEGCV